MEEKKVTKSEYLKTLTQQEKEKAWRDWGERCAKIVKDREETDEYYRKRIEEIYMPKVQAMPDPVDGEFALQVGTIYKEEENQNGMKSQS